MTLNASGAISLGGATTGESINLELNQSATATITMNDANVRTLAGVASGAIALNNFYNKSNLSYWTTWPAEANGTSAKVAGGVLGASAPLYANGYFYVCYCVSKAVSPLSDRNLVLVAYSVAGAIVYRGQVELTNRANKIITPLRCKVDSSGNIYVVCNSTIPRPSTGDVSYPHALLAKFSSTCVVSFVKTVRVSNATDSYTSSTCFDEVRDLDVAIDSSGNIYLGMTVLYVTNSDQWGVIGKFNSSFTHQWTKIWGNSSGSGNPRGIGGLYTDDTYLYVGDYYCSPGGAVFGVRKIGLDGTLNSSYTILGYGSGNAGGISRGNFAVDSSLNFYMNGLGFYNQSANGNQNRTRWLARIKSDFTSGWIASLNDKYGAGIHTMYSSTAVLDNGNIAWSSVGIEGKPHLVVTNANGAVQFERSGMGYHPMVNGIINVPFPHGVSGGNAAIVWWNGNSLVKVPQDGTGLGIRNSRNPYNGYDGYFTAGGNVEGYGNVSTPSLTNRGAETVNFSGWTFKLSDETYVANTTATFLTANTVSYTKGTSIDTTSGSYPFMDAGTYTWVCPSGVTSVSAVVIGAGGGGCTNGRGGGGGGGTRYINSYSVTPGSSYTVTVGDGGNGYLPGYYGAGSGHGSSSNFAGTTASGGAGGYTCYVPGGSGSGGTGGGSGGSGAPSRGGGGGAGGYSGNGGGGSGSAGGAGSAGAGGGGSGGQGWTNYSWYCYYSPGVAGGSGDGGGQMLVGQLTSGGCASWNGSCWPGFNAGNTRGSPCVPQRYFGYGAGTPSAYVYACENSINSVYGRGRNGGGGAVRIVYGSGRTFPSTCVGSDA